VGGGGRGAGGGQTVYTAYSMGGKRCSDNMKRVFV
jgi:hypothetical protein